MEVGALVILCIVVRREDIELTGGLKVKVAGTLSSVWVGTNSGNIFADTTSLSCPLGGGRHGTPGAKIFSGGKVHIAGCLPLVYFRGVERKVYKNTSLFAATAHAGAVQVVEFHGNG